MDPAAASSSMLDLLPLPVISATLDGQQQQHRSPSSSSRVTKLSMATTARLLPGGTSFDYEAKQKRISFVPESQISKKEMDSLFGELQQPQEQQQKQQQKQQQMVKPDCVVVRVLHAGGFVVPPSSSRRQQQQHHRRHIDDFGVGGESVSSQATATPGLAFVGRVVTAGSNVHFLNEWIADPAPTSILPRGYKEGDLVCGLQCSRDFLSRTQQLSGSLGTYVSVPACFVFRLTKEDFIVEEQQTKSLESSVLQSLAAHLFPTTLWTAMLRWHIDPKAGEPVLFLSANAAANSSMMPAIGAMFACARCGDGNKKNVFVVAKTEEDALMLERQSSSSSSSSSPSSPSSSSSSSFQVLRWFRDDSFAEYKEAFQHVIFCDDDVLHFHGDDESCILLNRHQQNQCRLREALSVVLRHGGSVGYLSTRLFSSDADGGDGDADDGVGVAATSATKRIAASILPAVTAVSGRLAVVTTQTLFDAPPERMRRCVAEALAVLVSGVVWPPAPARVIRLDSRAMEPLQKQMRQFVLEKSQQQQQQQNQQMQPRWCELGDRVGAVVSEWLERATASLFLAGGGGGGASGVMLPPAGVVVQFPA